MWGIAFRNAHSFFLLVLQAGIGSESGKEGLQRQPSSLWLLLWFRCISSLHFQAFVLSRSQCSSPGATGISGLHSRRTRRDRHSYSLAISSSAAPFSFCLQFFLASGSFWKYIHTLNFKLTMILLERSSDLFQTSDNVITNFLGKADKHSKFFWKRRTGRSSPRTYENTWLLQQKQWGLVHEKPQKPIRENRQSRNRCHCIWYIFHTIKSLPQISGIENEQAGVKRDKKYAFLNASYSVYFGTG